MKIHLRSICYMLLLLAFVHSNVMAQTTRRITGVVYDNSTKQTIPGVSILVKGTQNGTSTGANGEYALSVRAEDRVLTVSSVGYATQEIAVPAGSRLNINLVPSTNKLKDVVVTALGIKRERKALGYAVQEVKGSTLAETQEPNLTNALSGKVAGLMISKSSNGPAGSSKIILRGFNSLTGDNQPLIVVDGVPIENFTGVTNNDIWSPELDLGNGLSDINPEDIETLSVLKGGAAAALYGARAGNGVILITTKSGRAVKGLGITVSTNLGISNPFITPKMQTSFGQGTEGNFDNLSVLSWGPKIAGQSITNWDGTSVPMNNYDNVKNYLDKGVTSNTSFTLQQNLKDLSIYTSANYLDDRSIIPGATLKRLNLMGKANLKFGENKRWTADTKIQFSNAIANNRPVGGIQSTNVFNTLYLLPVSLDITQFKNALTDEGKMLWFGGSSQYNPYWLKQYNTNQDTRNRFIMNGGLNYKINDYLNVDFKAGADQYNTNTYSKLYGGSPSTPTGRYSEGSDRFVETNYSLMLNGSKSDLFGKVGGSFVLGGNIMRQSGKGLTANVGELEVPNLFAVGNGKSAASLSPYNYEKRMNSLFASAQLSYDGWFYLDGTARNDWSSTLSKKNRSFFYPSVSASYVFSEMITRNGGELPSWLSYGKIRASWATVGNDLPPYQLSNDYVIGKDPNSVTTASRQDIYFDENVVNELIKTREVGAELKFFNNRFGLDFTYYKSNATNQLINLPLDPLSGYKYKKINAGNIQNEGIEAALTAGILRPQEGLNWDLTINASHNKNTIIDLYEGVPQYPLGGFDDVQILAQPGLQYGAIYGSVYKRVTDKASPYYNQLLLNADGLPEKADDKAFLGDQQARALLGINNSFSYKGVNFSFQVDGRFGGKIFSTTLSLMQKAGTAEETVVNGARDNMVVPGVVADGSGYKPNTVAVTPQRYWNAVNSGNTGITEANVYDATNVRLRNVQLSYSLPKTFLSKTPIQGARIGVSCNNVWMISSKLKGIDPESVFATGSNALGFENNSPPTSRVFMFNLSLSF